MGQKSEQKSLKASEATWNTPANGKIFCYNAVYLFDIIKIITGRARLILTRLIRSST